MTGIDHSKAGLDIRSLFSFTKKSMEAAIVEMKKRPGIKGVVIISTCNRMECYISCEEDSTVDLPALLCELKGQNAGDYAGYFVVRENMDAVRHLFSLASGLRSKILGEDQIISQVRDAHTFSRTCEGIDLVLDTCFRMAVTAAKKVKTEVVLSHENRSIIHTAIAQLKKLGYTFEGKNCLVIGNGAMGKLTASTLVEEGAKVTVTVRQYRSGIVEIPGNCRRINYGERSDLFPQMDYIVSATSSPNYTITKELLENTKRKENVVLLDLAVPRDIDPVIREEKLVTVFDVDDFHTDYLSEEAKENVEQAKVILEEQANEFEDWLEGRDVIPRIQNIKHSAAEDMVWRMTGIVKKLPLADEERELLFAQLLGAAEKTVNRMLFDLKNEIRQDTFRECLGGLEQVYGTEHTGK